VETKSLEDTLHIKFKALPYHDLLSSIFLTIFALENQSHKELVKSIAERYIKNKRSIILAVLGAHYDRQMQEITEMATRHDPNGERTFSTIARSDTTERGTPAEQT
jgi:hypothetical protein